MRASRYSSPRPLVSATLRYVLTVVAVEPGTELLTQVHGLWRRHSSTLGFFTEGAFDEHARNRWILAAVATDGRLLGYTLFRTTRRGKTSIAHLCVEPQARGQGVASQLFSSLRLSVSSCYDIVVRCRRDYEASALWPRLGFVSVGETAGRGKDAQVLTIWRYELNRLPLLAAMDRRSDDVMPVAIDANVFFDLDDVAGPTVHDESKSLAADWLGEFIELCVTEEIFNEIDRHQDPSQRARQRSRVDQFRVLPSDKAREEQVLSDLQRLFPEWDSDSARSDMRQLTRTIAGGATYFVTRDGLVRDQADKLYERYGLVIVSPFELVLRFDELRREEEYRPTRFITLGLKSIKPRNAADLDRIADLLHMGQPSPEPRGRTLARLRDISAAPDRFEVCCIGSDDGTLLAAYAIDRPMPEVFRVPFFAVVDSPIGRTAARHLVDKLTILAAAERRTVLIVMGNAGGSRVEEALISAGFSREPDYWIKLAVPAVAGALDVALDVDRIGGEHSEAKSLASRAVAHLRPDGGSACPEALAHVERALWPAKIIGTGLPCYIVPIRPAWAAQLFDVELANRTLFGADPRLAMNTENAYYRAARPAILKAPGRVLWYVSHDAAYPGTKAVRACSYLDEVLVAQPKDAFRRFRRLGVYTWVNVFKIADNDVTREVMAFRFSKTEVLRRPLPWHRLQEELTRSGGGRSQFQSPLQISEACFFELYRFGMVGG